MKKGQIDYYVGTLMELSEKEQKTISEENILQYLPQEVSQEYRTRIFYRYCYLTGRKVEKEEG